MPYKLLTPCRHPGCPELTNGGYCERHRKQHQQQYSRQRTDVAEQAFYRSKRWRITSEQYRAYHPVCKCGKPTRLVHHTTELTELLRRGLDPCDWRYLEGCCWSCHEKTKR